jgi:uncharacterized protein (TIGR01777 family)
MIILLTGATGFIGRPLVSRLAAEGHRLRILTRNLQATQCIVQGYGTSVTPHAWPREGAVPEEAIAGADAVIHLAGESIGSWPWSGGRKRRILESRVKGTRALVEAMAATVKKGSGPRVFISASAVGYYGDSGDAIMKETDVPVSGSGSGSGFLAEVSRAWEAEIFKAEASGIRTVAIRNGLVLGHQGGFGHQGGAGHRFGGALAKMLPAFRCGLGAVMGSGDQYWSWIHIEDTVGIFLHALVEERMRGPVNGAAPEPVTQREFSRILAGALHRPLLFRAPAFALRLVLGEMADTLLGGQRADAGKLASLGYRFRYPGLPAAFADLLAP